jgi:type IV secretory pathway VirB10-like protein
VKKNYSCSNHDLCEHADNFEIFELDEHELKCPKCGRDDTLEEESSSRASSDSIINKLKNPLVAGIIGGIGLLGGGAFYCLDDGSLCSNRADTKPKEVVEKNELVLQDRNNTAVVVTTPSKSTDIDKKEPPKVEKPVVDTPFEDEKKKLAEEKKKLEEEKKRLEEEKRQKIADDKAEIERKQKELENKEREIKVQKGAQFKREERARQDRLQKQREEKARQDRLQKQREEKAEQARLKREREEEARQANRSDCTKQLDKIEGYLNSNKEGAEAKALLELNRFDTNSRNCTPAEQARGNKF